MSGAGPSPRQAVVVFSGVTDLPWLRLLRPGFRHCFVVLQRGGAWVVVDPLAHCTRLDLAPASLAAEAEAIAAVYRRLGLTAVTVEEREAPRRLAPVRPYTCVEAVKRLIGWHAPLVLTPWQLYRALGNGDKILKKEKNLDTAVLSA